MPDALSAAPPSGADVIGAAGALSNGELAERLDGLFDSKAALEGAIVVLLGEVARRQASRDEGATSCEAWVAERFGVSAPSARALIRGETGPGTSRTWSARSARVRCPWTRCEPSSRWRHQRPSATWWTWPGPTRCATSSMIARTSAAARPPSRSEHDRRFLRCNDSVRTVTVQLPAESYAQARTMLVARARTIPSDAQRREVRRRDRRCRFPGCANATFTNTHHVVPWKPDGRTDLENLALLCLHHHHLGHSTGWTMSGNANEELRFVGPTGRVMTTRPSLRWTAVTAGLGG